MNNPNIQRIVKNDEDPLQEILDSADISEIEVKEEAIEVPKLAFDSRGATFVLDHLSQV